MAKFSKPTDSEPVPPAERTIPNPPPPVVVQSAPQVTVVDVNNNQNNSGMAQQTVQMQMQTSQTQAIASVGLAQASLDKEVIDEQISKEEEHWVKAYWRPAMGWLYMAICMFDFIIFPMLAMFLPVIEKGFGVQIGYTPWVSLSLSNGGLIHLAFGAILGVSAWTRGQEKLAKLN